MSGKNSDEPVYPMHGLSLDRDGDYSLYAEGGLTKREAFAMAAMQGLLANGHFANELEKMHETQPTGSFSFVEFLTKSAVVYADSLLTMLDGSRK